MVTPAAPSFSKVIRVFVAAEVALRLCLHIYEFHAPHAYQSVCGCGSGIETLPARNCGDVVSFIRVFVAAEVALRRYRSPACR